jgi:hypothetical protein
MPQCQGIGPIEPTDLREFKKKCLYWVIPPLRFDMMALNVVDISVTELAITACFRRKSAPIRVLQLDSKWLTIDSSAKRRIAC